MSTSTSESVPVVGCANGTFKLVPGVDCDSSVAVARGNRDGSMGISMSINL